MGALAAARRAGSWSWRGETKSLEIKKSYGFYRRMQAQISALQIVQEIVIEKVRQKGPVSGFVGFIPHPSLESRINRNL